MLELLNGIEHGHQEKLSQAFSSCFGILWPMAVQKIGTETLLECFGSLLSSLPLCGRNEGLARVGGTVISSYRNSLGNSSNKKKVLGVPFVVMPISIYFIVLDLSPLSPNTPGFMAQRCTP